MDCGGDSNGLFAVNSSLVTVAHELKSPLALIRQLSLSLEEDLSPAELQSIGAKLNLTSNRALKMVSDLTKVSRLEDALFELAPINPHSVCNEVLFSLKDLYKLNQRRLVVRYTNQPKLFMGNRELLESIVYNFCDNAMRYSGENLPSELFVKSIRNQKIRIGVRDFGPCLPTEIWRDIKKGNGLDIPQKILGRPGSSGLGLFIASKFIKVMHGTFGVIRHKDGTTLYADFPVSNQLSLL